MQSCKRQKKIFVHLIFAIMYMICLSPKLDVNQYIKFKLEIEEIDLISSEIKAICEEIIRYEKEKFNLKVSSLYIY